MNNISQRASPVMREMKEEKLQGTVVNPDNREKIDMAKAMTDHHGAKADSRRGRGDLLAVRETHSRQKQEGHTGIEKGSRTRIVKENHMVTENGNRMATENGSHMGTENGSPSIETTSPTTPVLGSLIVAQRENPLIEVDTRLAQTDRQGPSGPSESAMEHLPLPATVLTESKLDATSLVTRQEISQVPAPFGPQYEM
jgi:hypothetical protein